MKQVTKNKKDNNDITHSLFSISKLNCKARKIRMKFAEISNGSDFSCFHFISIFPCFFQYILKTETHISDEVDDNVFQQVYIPRSLNEVCDLEREMLKMDNGLESDPVCVFLKAQNPQIIEKLDTYIYISTFDFLLFSSFLSFQFYYSQLTGYVNQSLIKDTGGFDEQKYSHSDKHILNAENEITNWSSTSSHSDSDSDDETTIDGYSREESSVTSSASGTDDSINSASDSDSQTVEPANSFDLTATALELARASLGHGRRKHEDKDMKKVKMKGKYG